MLFTKRAGWSLSSDLKSQIAVFYGPARQAAEHYMEELRQATNTPSRYIIETKAAFANILSKINAEVDLFCAAYTVQKKQKIQGIGPTFNSFTGIHGNSFMAYNTAGDSLVMLLFGPPGGNHKVLVYDSQG
jgi:hypothetical protein